MDNDVLIAWLEAMIKGNGRGGKTLAAKNLGVSASGISKYLARGSGFHDPTIRLMSWILSSKSENYPKTKLLKTVTHNRIAIEIRKLPDGEKIYTWRKA